MDFYIQDPSFPGTYTIHEALIKACDGAKYGGGAYAFVSAEGARLFLEDDTFKQMVVNRGAYKVIVGMDEITNDRAVKKLIEIRDTYRGHVEIYAFLQDSKEAKESLFHPKFSWFKKENGGDLVVGSGNLTEKGLRRNREAFSIVIVDEAKLAEIEAYWNDWLAHNARYLRAIDDDEVMERGKQNKIKYLKIKKNIELDSTVKDLSVQDDHDDIGTPFTIEDEVKEAWTFTNENFVFITEINKNGTRSTQVNLNQYDFKNYFGGDPTRQNKSYRVLFRSVLSDGSFNDLEIRPGVPVQSKNYRFELEAMAEQPYPVDLNTRPIGVFIKISTRDFLYIIAWPTDSFYNEIKLYLYRKTAVTRADRMKKYRTEVQELRATIPQLPFWHN